MDKLEALKYIWIAWAAMLAVWAVGAGLVKPAVRTESAESQSLHGFLVLLAWILLFPRRFPVPPLNLRFVPDISPVWELGLATTVIGIGLAIWARFYLGGNWSSTVTIKREHTLIRSGPYAMVRHPIYTGLLLAMLGTAIASGELRGLVAVALATIGWRVKSLVEEKFMTDQFGEQYVRYKREVKALIPFLL